jgi:two-component system, response regulator YesN
MTAYKVLIVDDEMVIRYGLSSCVDWSQEGFELIGEASNGAVALQIIRENPVNILITDIKMPVMDGLELVRQAKVAIPSIKVIFISSYSDFEYAREAVKLGVVVDYLLKPTMEPGDLLRILNTCRDMLDKEARYERETGLFLQQEKKTKREELERRIKQLLSGQPVPPEGLPGWMLEPLSVAVWNPDEWSGHEHAEGLDRLMQIEAAHGKLSEWCGEGLAVVTGEEELVTILPDRRGGAMAEVERYHNKLRNEESCCFTVGISPSISKVETLATACRWARSALDQAFYDGRGKCYTGKIPSASVEDSTKQGEWFDLKERFSRMLAASDRDGGNRVLEEVFARWEKRRMPKAEVLRQAQSLLTLIASRHAGLQVEEMAIRLLDSLQSIRHVHTLAGLKAALSIPFRQLWDSDRSIPVVASADVGSAHAVQLAISYIQEHYRGELSLREVADHVHMSKNYFSEQFKRLTGLNFIDYVIRLRIGHAKRLLRTTGLRIYDIGSQAGFHSSKHFLKLFKREVECTPAEYRQRALQEEHKDVT